MYPSARKHSAIYPRPLLLFAGAWGIAGYMTYDGYPVDGAGTMAAWSSLYLLANGWKRSMKPLWKVRAVGPAALTAWSIGTAVVGGWYWSNTSRHVAPKE
ncbi:hypothetical protein EDC01DRAFT_662888 [Geopyxis carbonaria]|nr:hypothetical protein EDC01DRAFT_662888 [Geopyxis carbonaria]